MSARKHAATTLMRSVGRTVTLSAIALGLIAAPSANAARPAPTPPTPGPGGVRVATLEGVMLPSGTTSRQLNGEVCKAPNVCDRVSYNNNGSTAGMNDGVAKLDKWIRATPGKKLVFGYSLGSIVAEAWLRKYNSDPTAPAADQLSFLLIGNPERAVTGSALGDAKWGLGTGVGNPPNLKYQITDVCKKWDGVCYKINGDARSSFGAMSVHLAYGNAKLNDAKREVRVEGNVTYVLLPTPGWC